MAKGAWETLRDTIAGWLGDNDSTGADSSEDEADPSMVFYLALIAPLILGLIALSRRAL